MGDTKECVQCGAELHPAQSPGLCIPCDSGKRRDAEFRELAALREENERLKARVEELETIVRRLRGWLPVPDQLEHDDQKHRVAVLDRESLAALSSAHIEPKGECVKLTNASPWPRAPTTAGEAEE